MKTLGWVISVSLVLLTVFAAANWSLLAASASLNFLLFTVEGPYGLILFVAVVLFAALFGVYAVSLRTSALLETRRHLKDLEAQRQLADNAEASRLAALTAQITQEFGDVRTALEAARAESQRRSEALEQTLCRHLDETANSLFANVGQIDDKLNRIAAREGRPGSS